MAKILVVDDSQLICHMTKEYLEPVGHAVSVAQTGQEAMKAVEGSKPDLVLLDVQLPDTSGFNVCSQLRSAGHSFPIILSSASDSYSPWIHQLAQGFLFKPYTQAVLQSKVQSLLGSSSDIYDVKLLSKLDSWSSSINLIHHLRNSVGCISGLLDMLKVKKDDAAFRDKFMTLTQQAVDSSVVFVEEFAELTRPLDLKKEELELDAWLSKFVLGHPLTRARAIAVRWQIDTGSLVPVPVDMAQIERAVKEILDNALEAMPEGGTLTIGAYGDARRKWVYMMFQDTGEGMDSYVADRACTPFFTMKRNKRGIGLSWAQKIARAHGGELEISSNPGAGTCVLIKLPAKTSGKKEKE